MGNQNFCENHMVGISSSGFSWEIWLALNIPDQKSNMIWWLYYIVWEIRIKSEGGIKVTHQLHFRKTHCCVGVRLQGSRTEVGQLWGYFSHWKREDDDLQQSENSRGQEERRGWIPDLPWNWNWWDLILYNLWRWTVRINLICYILSYKEAGVLS